MTRLATIRLSALLMIGALGIVFADDAKAVEPTAKGSDAPATAAQKQRQKQRRKPQRAVKVDLTLPTVLILGDSISIGYTKPLREMLSGKANVLHNPGNSQGTTHTLANIDKWLTMGKWDVIHFNLGLHDLKRVKAAGTSQNSNDPNDPYQADLKTYAANLKKIVEKLKATNAHLVFATTTPFPGGVKPYRDPKDAKKYNEAALAIMREHGVVVNDLHAFTLPRLKTLQRPRNVHFTSEGSKQLAAEVAKHISDALPEQKTDSEN